VNAWQSCIKAGLSLRAGNEPLDSPQDLVLAQRIVEHRAVTTALNEEGLQIDLTLEMAGFQFDRVWRQRRIFRVDGVDIPVARLTDIVMSKAKAGREKDRLFLATDGEALRQMQAKSP
jgi:predicted nucleotidyltransferase